MKPWARLQDLVASIEAVAAPLGATVASPAFLTDRNTGEEREVDAVIRYSVGTAQVLIAIECRLHKRAQDVQWIEQLIGKRESVGADILIAVSGRGFTKAAKRLAQQKGIQLRTLRAIDKAEIDRWMHVVVQVYSHVEVTEAGMRIGEGEKQFIFLDDFAAPEYKDENGKIPLDKPFFHSASGNETWPLKMFAGLVRRGLGVPVRDIVPRDGSRIRKRYLCRGSPLLLVPTIWGMIPSTEFSVEVEMWAEHKMILPEVSSYSSEDGSVLARRVSYRFEGGDSPASLEFQDAGPGTSMSRVFQIYDKDTGEMHLHVLPDEDESNLDSGEKDNGEK